jgi:hypothetical protein
MSPVAKTNVIVLIPPESRRTQIREGINPQESRRTQLRFAEGIDHQPESCRTRIQAGIKLTYPHLLHARESTTAALPAAYRIHT